MVDYPAGRADEYVRFGCELFDLFHFVHAAQQQQHFYFDRLAQDLALLRDLVAQLTGRREYECIRQ